ncbi:coiled-coil-helix-coiled-coil-helix domain-containing protein 7-like [Pollicipes pollicipes]|uniref:coiled-coil-helix-coiled-coil-helix domain-containing protein 7-like n=1 Tax=Pollicipes pollicipes TaxID=41117 RepID=UPI0018859EC5|nr:coiled-coil-helix-coiled-coil-helix domain-containing protein 7-like [Pollicipes pollicipes]XP_037090746.1 coiled-coil-helix-coiled-coil-helix domain-containing protein 7-like [Pollicipes pollicipes]
MNRNAGNLPKATNEAERQRNIRAGSQISELNNPCLSEQSQVQKCMDKSGYDKEKCQLHMNNYNACKRFWGEVRRRRRKEGLEPELPPPEERAAIKKEFLSKGHL